MRKLMLGAIATAAFAGCTTGEQCLVTTQGNKLCGADAAAWCQVTDNIRQQALNTGDADPVIKSTQDLCDKLESSS